MTQDVAVLNDQAQQFQSKIKKVFDEVKKVIVGQSYLVERLFLGLIANGHILVEGVPGLAKTRTVKALSDIIDSQFQRIQFTPDLLPADILGTQIYNPKTQEFTVKRGPLFSNVILADEINRAPAKVQSALLEAMQEKQITIGEQTFRLNEPFIVMATQNPIEQEGTYPLPEAQLDRFMLKLSVSYPTADEELEIMQKVTSPTAVSLQKIIHQDEVLAMREMVKNIYIDPKVNDYIVRLIFSTRHPEEYNLKLENYIRFGASPRASINMNLASKALALINGRGFVVPQDVKDVAMDVLRHRLLLTYEAEAEGITSEEIISNILNTIDVP